jgi:ketopantoate reductase
MSKTTVQPERFFEEAKVCLEQLRGIPVVAIDALQRDELTRDVIISIIRTCLRICRETGLDIEDEIMRQTIRESSKDNLKEMMRDDRLISMDELRANGLKIQFTENGPIVVPVSDR